MESRSIALDGPGGAGKSTLARRAAGHFKMIYVDTGALYRCIALYVISKGFSTTDLERVSSLLPEIDLEMKYDDDANQRMFICGEDVTDDIRTPEVSMGASNVSALPPVRQFLLSMQREMADKYDVIMDGRDIGTVVLPNAGLKVYLTADSDVRSKRRYLELTQKNIVTTLADVSNEMVLRDTNDSERELAPLKPSDDSVILDTTNLDLDESFSALCKLIAERFHS